MPPEQSPFEVAPDGPGYVETWARQLVAAIGKREARLILADYKRLSADKRLSKADRQVAAERAKWLRLMV